MTDPYFAASRRIVDGLILQLKSEGMPDDTICAILFDGAVRHTKKNAAARNNRRARRDDVQRALAGVEQSSEVH